MANHCFSAADMLVEHDIASPPDSSVTSSTTYSDCLAVDTFRCDKLHTGVGDAEAEVTSSTPLSTAFDENAYMDNIDIDSLQPTLSPVAGLSLTDLDKNPYSPVERLSVGDLNLVSECATLLSRDEKSTAVYSRVFDPVISNVPLSAQAPLTVDSLSSTDISADEIQEFLQHASKLNGDVMLSEGNQCNDESVCIDGFDVLQLADVYHPSYYNTGSLIRTEDFILDDAEWNCVQSWSSLIDHTTCSENVAVEFEEDVPCFSASINSLSLPIPTFALSSNSLLSSKESTSSKQLRRSSRIQDNELRDLAQKIRQENQEKERQECTKSPVCSQVSVAHDVPEAEEMVKLVPCGITLERLKLDKSQCAGGKLKYSGDESIDRCKKHRSNESDDVVYNREKHDIDYDKVESYSVTVHPTKVSAYGITSSASFKLKLTKITEKNESAGNDSTLDLPKSLSENVGIDKEHSRFVKCCGPDCHQPAAVASVYCSDACIQRCVIKFTRLQQKRHQGQYHMIAATDNVVMLERGSGKLVTGNHAPTTTSLLSWIRRHPTFEVVYPQHIQGKKTGAGKLWACRDVLKKQYDSEQKLKQVDNAVACQERKTAAEQNSQVSMHVDPLRTRSDIYSEVATDTAKLQMGSPDVQTNSPAHTDTSVSAGKHKHTSAHSVKVRDTCEASTGDKINTKETCRLHRKSDSSNRKMHENKTSCKMLEGHKNHRKQLHDNVPKSRSGRCHEKQTYHEVVPHHIRAEVHVCSSKQKSGEVGLQLNLVSEAVNNDDMTKNKSDQKYEIPHSHTRGTVDHDSKKSSEVSDSGEKNRTVDARRLHVRNGICRALSSRLPELSDTSAVSSTRLKHLAIKIELEMYSFYGDVNSLYQRKYRALAKHLTDASNKGLFRRVIYSDISPTRLVQTNSQSLGSEQLAQWKGRPSAVVVSSSSVPVLTSVLSYSCADSVSLVNVDTTSQHGQHVFDVSCQICSGQRGLPVSTRQCSSELSKVKHPSDGLQKSTTLPDTTDESHKCEVSNLATETNESVHQEECDTAVSVQPAVNQASCQSKLIVVNTLCESDELSSLSDGKCNANDSLKHDNNDKNHLMSIATQPQKSLVGLADYSRSAANRQDSANGELSTDSFITDIHDKQIPSATLITKPNTELIWHGTIVSPDVTNVDVTLHRVSGSMKFLRNDLPRVLTVMGRISPDVMCDYLEKIKFALIVTREIAVVCFNASPGHEGCYNQLYCYLQERRRCAVFGSIGPSIKDMYIWPLSAKSALPSILLPLGAPGLTTDHADVLLGIVVQHCNNHQRVKATIPPSPHESRLGQQVSASVPYPTAKHDQLLFATNNAASANMSAISSQQQSLSENKVLLALNKHSVADWQSKSSEEGCHSKSLKEGHYSNPTISSHVASPPAVNVLPSTRSTVQMVSVLNVGGDEPYEPNDEDVEELSSTHQLPSTATRGEIGCSNEYVGQLMQTIDVVPSSDTMSALLTKLTSSDNVSVDSKKQLLMQLIMLMKTQVKLGQNNLAESPENDVANTSTLNSDATIEARNEMDKLMAWKTRIENAVAEDPAEQRGMNDKQNVCSKIMTSEIESASLCLFSKPSHLDADGDSSSSFAEICSIESPTCKCIKLNSQLAAEHDDCTMYVKASELSPPASPTSVSEITPCYELKPVIIDCSTEFPPLSMPPKPPDNLLSMHCSFSTDLPVLPLPPDFSYSTPSGNFVAHNNTAYNIVTDSPMSPPLMLDRGVHIDAPPLLHLGPSVETVGTSGASAVPHDDKPNQLLLCSPQLVPAPSSTILPPQLLVLPKAVLPAPPARPVPGPPAPNRQSTENYVNSHALMPSLLTCAQSAVSTELHNADSHRISLKTTEVRNCSNRHVDTNSHQLLCPSVHGNASNNSFRYELGNDYSHCQKISKTLPAADAVSVSSSNGSLHCIPPTENVVNNNKVSCGDLLAPGIYLRQLLDNTVAVDENLSSLADVPVTTSFHSPQDSVKAAYRTRNDIVVSKHNSVSSSIRLKAPPKPETLRHSDTSAADPLGSFSLCVDNTDNTMFACQTIDDGQSSRHTNETIELEDGEIVEADDRVAVQQPVSDLDRWPQATKQSLSLLKSNTTRGSSTSRKVIPVHIPDDSPDISSHPWSYAEQHFMHSTRYQSDGQHQIMNDRRTGDIRLFHDKPQTSLLSLNSQQTHDWHLNRIQSPCNLTQPGRYRMPRFEKHLHTASDDLSFNRSSDFVDSRNWNGHEDPVIHAELRNRWSVDRGFVDSAGALAQQNRPSDSSQLSQLSYLHSSALELSQESGRELVQTGRSRLHLRQPQDSSEPPRFETYADFSSAGSQQDDYKSKHFGFRQLR